MNFFNQAEFNNFIVENNIVGFFDKPITLKSGRQSYWYVNWRNVAQDVFLIDRLTDFVISFAKDLIETKEIERPDCFYGVAEGATKLGVLTQYKWAKSSLDYASGRYVLAMGRAMPKDHGMAKDRFFVGIPTGKVIVLEDITTTGLSLLQTLDQLIEADVEVIAAFGMTNRMDVRDDGMTVKEAVATRVCKGKQVPYFHLSAANDILPDVCKLNRPNEHAITELKEQFPDIVI